MKAFYFRLHTKLEICIRQEQIAREEMQRCLRERDILLEELQRRMQKLMAMEEEIRQESFKVQEFQALLVKREFIPVLGMQIEQAEQNLSQAEARVEESRVLLLERKRETGTLEKLKERAWQEYLFELQQEEQKIIDEIAINNHFRRDLA
ncbi:MAG: flagellar FliJ family protein [Syntrophomonas sp.]|nr:flagellar FliJ family protein [Syntrophomonas sp.]